MKEFSGRPAIQQRVLPNYRVPFFDELARVTAAGGTLVLAYSFGPGTPIFVAPDALRRRLAPLGFGGFEEIAAGSGTAFVARKL